ncbi:cadherin repeat domain-containing protein [Flavivirga eckloniae]|uniref:Uncharacterized protein n=1 Tax=Flavivirga eckloniae TaxID=1803846 RepID=A0A2K9PLI9_9FLAO|nr:cadherin repeat domain-containing protein [Flavivirga eckloniae]AUP77934.1 hypothetical protein C1H87_04085 [Flavivirga eckloniae]
MKHIYNILLIGIISCFFSCYTEEVKPTVITTSDYTVLVDYAVSAQDTIGNIPGTSNKGSVTFTIVSQSVPNALSIGETYGELIVQDASAFDPEINTEMNLVVSVSKNEITENTNISITIEEPCPDVNINDWLGKIAVVNNGTQTAAFGIENDCSILTLQGGDVAGLTCDVEAEISIQYEESDSNIGIILVERQAYDCVSGSNLELEADGEYDQDTGITTLNYTLYENNSINSTGTTTLFFDASSCTPVVNTAIWDGNLTVEEPGFFVVSGTGKSGCNTLEISGDILNWGCDSGLLPALEISFTPDSDGATTGTAVMERQNYNCNAGENLEIEATGTYNEDTSTIDFTYAFYIDGEEFFTGDIVITPN